MLGLLTRALSRLAALRQHVHACVTVLLKPHCGASGTPFMKTTTLFSATSLAICARARGRLTRACYL